MAGIQVPPDSTGKIVDTVTLSDAGVEVHRQKLVIAGKSGTAEVVAVINAAPSGSEHALATRQVGTVDVALAGKLAVSGTATVAGVVALTAGTANIGSINNISATVTVAGIVALTAGTANIGHLNHISQTVQVAIATPITVNNISATSVVAGSLNISGSVAVSGSINIFTTATVPSASRGPRCVIVSTSSNATLVAAPGAGLCIFVTQIAVSNAAGANTRARIGSSASIGQVQMLMAQSGGGFVMQFTPPWELSANEALLGSVKPNASEGIFNIHFFVGSADAF